MVFRRKSSLQSSIKPECKPSTEGKRQDKSFIERVRAQLAAEQQGVERTRSTPHSPEHATLCQGAIPEAPRGAVQSWLDITWTMSGGLAPRPSKSPRTGNSVVTTDQGLSYRTVQQAAVHIARSLLRARMAVSVHTLLSSIVMLWLFRWRSLDGGASQSECSTPRFMPALHPLMPSKRRIAACRARCACYTSCARVYPSDGHNPLCLCPFWISLLSEIYLTIRSLVNLRTNLTVMGHTHLRASTVM